MEFVQLGWHPEFTRERNHPSSSDALNLQNLPTL
jgi:hypothetical protein